MITGIHVASPSKQIGGGYVYQKCLLQSIMNQYLAANSAQKIIFFHSGDNLLIQELQIPSVDYGNYQGGLNEAVLRHGVDILWFLSIFYEQVDIPYIVPVWDLQHRLQPFFPEVSAGQEHNVREHIYSHVLPRATFILTGTETGKQEISFFYRVPPERIIVNPMPLPQYISDERIEQPSELLDSGLESGKFIFYPAQFWPHKNQIVLLKALKILIEQNLGFRLVLTGSDQGNLDYIKETISAMGLDQEVLLLGFVSDQALLWLYQNAAALTYASFFGPDNIPPLEAFSAGCPVIAANAAGIYEQLGDAAILVDPRDERAFATAVMELSDNTALRHSLIAKGRTLVKTRTADHYVQRVLALIDEFATIRRCWGSSCLSKYTPSLIEWCEKYITKKEIYALITLLSVCQDAHLKKMYDELLPLFNNITDLNSRAEAELAANRHHMAQELLNNALDLCVDYPPIYLNLAKASYKCSEIDGATEFIDKARYYEKRSLKPLDHH
ncbi:glycosyltransferase family 1 protein [Geobacter sp. SVR]|uniref:glycosyltransferase family 4 protein n=1 Tax=Geobacter sp. SVR TaxID=2495594 RepID=UPI00143F038D|nr:glycosyltransferase family 1 protein [Geobacter sp. SVR]BCS55961.1 hypothetical protein GSVR_42690 [Geobacter sp. SVR]GCF84724.1 hypothetical protein GSbR_13240 [Geobacter sp. SVR]